MSEDTYTGQATDPLSLNLYTYCKNNPIAYKDPSGNIAIVDDAAVIIIIYAGGAVVTATVAWLASPEGQKAINDGAVAIHDGIIIAGEVITSATQTTVDAVKSGVVWVGEKIGKGVSWAKDKSKDVSNSIKELFGGSSSASPDPDNDNRNWQSIKEKYLEKQLKEQRTDPHSVKYEYLGKKAQISKYDIKVDKGTGQLGIFEKATGELVEITSYIIK